MDLSIRKSARFHPLEMDDRAIVLNGGKWANATVWSCSSSTGEWVVKDFTACSPLVRWTWGRLSCRREHVYLRLLDGIEGVPTSPHCPEPGKLVYRKLPGRDLADLKRAGVRLPVDFFREAERIVFAMHQRGIAHLDLRKSANLLCLDNGRPAIIDFQSAVRLDRFPRFVQKRLKAVDYLGIYKHWLRLGLEQDIGPSRRQLLQTIIKGKRFWAFRPYPLRKLLKRRFGCKGSLRGKNNDF